MKRVSRACFSFLVGWILCFAVAHAATSWDASALKTVSPRADRSFPNGYEVVTEPGPSGQVIKEMPAGDAMVAAYVEVGGQRYYMTDWSYDRYRQGLMYNWIRAKSVGVAHAASSWDTSALKTVSPRADRSFPNGYEVVTEPGLNGQVIKEMPAGDAMVAAYVEVGGQRYYMTDWSYDRYRQGLMYNWIRAKSGSADEMKIVIHQEKPEVIQQETPKASAQTSRESAREADSAEDLAGAEKRLKYDWEDIEFLVEKRQKMIEVVESPNLDARFRASQEDELDAIEEELEAKVTAYRRARESLAERRQAANGTQETETSKRRDYIAEQQQKIRDDAAAYRQQLADERAERDAQNNAAMLQQLTTGLSDLNASMAERSKPWIRSEIKPRYQESFAPPSTSSNGGSSRKSPLSSSGSGSTTPRKGACVNAKELGSRACPYGQCKCTWAGR